MVVPVRLLWMDNVHFHSGSGPAVYPAATGSLASISSQPECRTPSEEVKAMRANDYDDFCRTTPL